MALCSGLRISMLYKSSLLHRVAICRDTSLGYSLKTWRPQLNTVFQMGSDQPVILTSLFSLFEAFLICVSHPTWHE